MHISNSEKRRSVELPQIDNTFQKKIFQSTSERWFLEVSWKEAIHKDVFRTLPSIYDGDLYENNWWLLWSIIGIWQVVNTPMIYWEKMRKLLNNYFSSLSESRARSSFTLINDTSWSLICLWHYFINLVTRLVRAIKKVNSFKEMKCLMGVSGIADGNSNQSSTFLKNQWGWLKIFPSVHFSLSW